MMQMIERFAEQKILVLGDLMLDEYLWGDAKRISPEAPVPVVDIQRESVAPGGACNVAVNAASLGGKIYLGGVVGKDAAAQQLKDELLRLNIDLSGIIEDDQRPTITKTRLVARNQQIVRYDREARSSLNKGLQQSLLDWAQAALPEVSLCVFSDYAKGISSPEFMQDFIELANQFHRPVIIDPKGNSLRKYKGALLLTPNLQEAEHVTGMEIHTDEDIVATFRIMQAQIPGTNILIKLGAHGMTLFHHAGGNYHVDAEARQVFDVTGAGDTVIAALAMALAAGADLEEATRLANSAAGIVVGKVGTATVTRTELYTQLEQIQ